MFRRACLAGLLMLSCCGVFAAAGTPGIWLDVPFIQQQKDGCGAASIAMVMQYWQQHGQPGSMSAEYTRIEDALLSRQAHGIYASAMEQYLHQNGYAAFAFTGDWNLLQHHLQMGRPLIVAVRPGALDPLHYEVVAGVEQDNQLILINDPAQRKLLKEDRATFEREWKATGRWTLLAVPQAASH